MSERERLRRLHVENRLAELRAKHGEPPPTIEPETFEEALARVQAARAAREPSDERRVLRASQVASVALDRYGETPIFECPQCGEESAKASMPIDLWKCTACDAYGSARQLLRPDELPATRVWHV